LRELRATFSLRVNPHDAEDQRLLQLISETNTEKADEFVQRVALLLKHDGTTSRGRPVETIPKLVELACAEMTRRRAEGSG
jgi:hypothetical protein